MPMPWFRMYHESRNDRKLDTLADDEFRVWHRLLCLASESAERGTIPGADDRLLLAIETARGDEELLERTLTRLVKLKIVTDDGNQIVFLNFIKRNYDKPSDTPQETAKRKREQRDRQRDGAGQGRDEGVTNDVSRDVTRSHATDKIRVEEIKPEEIENTILADEPPADEPVLPSDDGMVHAAPKPTTLNKRQLARFERWYLGTDVPDYKGYPNKQQRPDAERAWRKLDPDDALTEQLIADIQERRTGRKWAEGFVDYPAKYLNQRIWQDDIEAQRPENVHAIARGPHRGYGKQAPRGNRRRAVGAPGSLGPGGYDSWADKG